MNLSKNFILEEFRSKDGAQFPLFAIENLKKLAANLQIIRDTLNKPITILSGYRSPAHNAKVKGAKDSQHMKGTAADIRVVGMTPTQVAAVIKKLMDEKKITAGGLKAYETFVHYDVRGRYATW